MGILELIVLTIFIIIVFKKVDIACYMSVSYCPIPYLVRYLTIWKTVQYNGSTYSSNNRAKKQTVLFYINNQIINYGIIINHDVKSKSKATSSYRYLEFVAK